MRPEDGEALLASAGVESPVRFTPGTLLAGRYRIVAPAGKGGMGEVYRADDIRLGQPVALKFLPAAFAADSTRLQRLVDEVRIGRQISHPNVCRLYDIAEAEGHHFLVMEYVDGEDLASLLRRIGRLPGDKALDIARGICSGLAAAHDKGVIHRDLKPGNVMIDGRGHARIADFGLAALVHDGAAAEMSGTPQYMAPEQLTGGGASLRSDVYALGLVIHEMLTGKRVFEAKSLGELRALHADTKPLSLSTSSTDVDPILDRAVQRCLSRDPVDRPASAREVLLALPGGDPLQAAILAGETPSPEMVAAAGKVGDLSSTRAWLGLATGLVALWALIALSAQVFLYRLVPLDKSPDVLTQRARDILKRIGDSAPVADRASGFFMDAAQMDHIEKGDASLMRRDTLRRIQPGVFRFFYRQSPEELIPNNWVATLPWQGPPELGRIRRSEPPLSTPGMSETVVDSEGRLTSFTSIPPPFDSGAGPWPEPDWAVLMTEAGLDPASLRESTPRWAPKSASDLRRAWDGVYAGQPGVPIHVEAAAYHGRPTFFEVQGPWMRPAEIGAPPGNPWLSFALTVVFLATLPTLGGVILLVRRNLRMGRGDRRGSFRIALFTFVTLTLAQAFRADHTGAGRWEYALIVQIVSQGCYAAIAVWSIYMALEPAVRRRWPYMLISWSRLLQGRWLDPLVARDVLAGLILGFLLTVNDELTVAVPALFGRAAELGSNSVMTTLSSPRHLAFYLLLGPCLGIVYSLSLVLILYLLQALVRRAWLAQLLLGVFSALPVLAEAPNAVSFLGAAVFGLIVVLGLTRIGVLASVVSLFTFLVTLRSPLTFDASAWYFGRSLVVLVIFGGLVVVSAWVSLGGKPLFGKALLDD